MLIENTERCIISLKIVTCFQILYKQNRGYICQVNYSLNVICSTLFLTDIRKCTLLESHTHTELLLKLSDLEVRCNPDLLKHS